MSTGFGYGGAGFGAVGYAYRLTRPAAMPGVGRDCRVLRAQWVNDATLCGQWGQSATLRIRLAQDQTLCGAWGDDRGLKAKMADVKTIEVPEC